MSSVPIDREEVRETTDNDLRGVLPTLKNIIYNKNEIIFELRVLLAGKEGRIEELEEKNRKLVQTLKNVLDEAIGDVRPKEENSPDGFTQADTQG